MFILGPMKMNSFGRTIEAEAKRFYTEIHLNKCIMCWHWRWRFVSVACSRLNEIMKTTDADTTISLFFVVLHTESNDAEG